MLVCLSSHREAALASPEAGAPTAGYRKVWEARLPCDGRQAVSPPLGWEGPDTYRVEVTGLLDTGTLGAKYDAELRSISARELRVRHSHLRFASPGWMSIYANHPGHRYVYGLDAQASRRPERLRVSFEGIAYQFRISPQRLRRESTNTLRVSLWRKGAEPPRESSIRWDFAAFFAGLALLGALLTWAVRRRRRADQS